MFILVGLSYSFGVILSPVMEFYGSNRSLTSWVGSIMLGMYLMVGPVVGQLVNKFGYRIVGVAGSLLAALCIGLSTFSPNVPVLMVTYGLLGGISIGLISLPAVVAVGYHFKVITKYKRSYTQSLCCCM